MGYTYIHIYIHTHIYRYAYTRRRSQWPRLSPLLLRNGQRYVTPQLAQYTEVEVEVEVEGGGGDLRMSPLASPAKCTSYTRVYVLRDVLRDVPY